MVGEIKWKFKWMRNFSLNKPKWKKFNEKSSYFKLLLNWDTDRDLSHSHQFKEFEKFTFTSCFLSVDFIFHAPTNDIELICSQIWCYAIFMCVCTFFKLSNPYSYTFHVCIHNRKELERVKKFMNEHNKKNNKDLWSLRDIN